jgi:hypothetical protein
MTDEPGHGGTNEAVFVKTDDQMIYFEVLGMQSSSQNNEKLTFSGGGGTFLEYFHSAHSIVT